MANPPLTHISELDQWRAIALDEIATCSTPGAPPRSPYLLRQACDRIAELERPWWRGGDEQRAAFAQLPSELPQPTPDDCDRWRAAAAEIPGPLGRCIQILVAAVQRLGADGERQRALLRRVRCYAVVDPLGNPNAVALPQAARMLGIESDIDDHLEGRPPRPSLDLFPAALARMRAAFGDSDDSGPPKHSNDWHWCSGGCGSWHYSHYSEDNPYRCACGATCKA